MKGSTSSSPRPRPPLLGELHGLAREIGLLAALGPRLEQWKTEHGKSESLAKALGIIGYLADETSVDTVAPYLYHRKLPVKKAAVGCLRRIGSPSCLNHLFAPLKMSCEELALEILDLINDFQDQKCVLPLLGAMCGSEEAVQDKIIDVLDSYPAGQREAVIEENLDRSDLDLCRMALKMYEQTGQLDAARKIRDRFDIKDEIKPGQNGAAAQLGVQVKLTGDIALIALAGILDVYSLPTLVQIVEKLIVKGQFKILILAEQVTEVDDEALRTVNELTQKLDVYGGSIKMIKLHAADKAKKDEHFSHVEEFSDLKRAILAFSARGAERTIRLEEHMISSGTPVELEVKQGQRSWSRRSSVISFDGKQMLVEWPSGGPDDVFNDNQTVEITMTLVHRNSVIEFEMKMLEQVFFPQPHIVLDKPKMGRVVDRRRHVRIPTGFPVSFYHIIDNNTIRNDLSGTCGNISIGGMLLLTKEAIPIGNAVIIIFKGMAELNNRKVMGKVVRRQRAGSAQNPLFACGVAFQLLPADIQDTISKLVFKTISAELEHSV